MMSLQMSVSMGATVNTLVFRQYDSWLLLLLFLLLNFVVLFDTPFNLLPATVAHAMS